MISFVIVTGNLCNWAIVRPKDSRVDNRLTDSKIVSFKSGESRLLSSQLTLLHSHFSDSLDSFCTWNRLLLFICSLYHWDVGATDPEPVDIVGCVGDVLHLTVGIHVGVGAPGDPILRKSLLLGALGIGVLV